MKNQVSPAAAVVVVLAIVGVAAFTWFRFFAGGAGTNAGEKPPGMPADVAARFKELGGPTGPGKPAGGNGANGAGAGNTAPGAATAPGGFTAPGSGQ